MDDRSTSIIKNIDGQAQLLVAALGASISGIVITDWQQEDNPIIFCNGAFEEMTDFQSGRDIGQELPFPAS
jgi:PAS domain-containing protein